MSVIKIERVSKVFHRASDRTLLRDKVRRLFTASSAGGFYALKDVSLSVKDGESVALVGANGAGKSTLLALVCGLAQPDGGRIEVQGRVATLLELASGFHPDLTGRENVMLNAALLGLQRKRAQERLDSIVEFAEIGAFIDQQMRTYSSGMVARLGFSVAVHCDPSLVVIDEVLGVGDAAFRTKCQDRIKGFRREGKTLLFVSHNALEVKGLCSRAVWLDHGQVMMDGPAEAVMAAYTQFVAEARAGD